MAAMDHAKFGRHVAQLVEPDVTARTGKQGLTLF
jgi:hypothetical protein